MRRGLVVLGFSRELPEGLVDGRMHLDVGGSTQPDGHQVIRDRHVVPGQGQEPFEWLSEHEEKNGDGSVSDGQVGGVDVVVDRLGLCVGIELSARAAAMWGESEVRVDEPGFDGPAEESACDTSGSGPAGLPGVEVALTEALASDTH